MSEAADPKNRGMGTDFTITRKTAAILDIYRDQDKDKRTAAWNEMEGLLHLVEKKGHTRGFWTGTGFGITAAVVGMILASLIW